MTTAEQLLTVPDEAMQAARELWSQTMRPAVVVYDGEWSVVPFDATTLPAWATVCSPEWLHNEAA